MTTEKRVLRRLAYVTVLLFAGLGAGGGVLLWVLLGMVVGHA